MNGCIYNDLVPKFIHTLYLNFLNDPTNYKAHYKMNDNANIRAESPQNQRQIDKLKDLEAMVDEQMQSLNGSFRK